MFSQESWPKQILPPIKTIRHQHKLGILMNHYNDVIMSSIASQITSLTVVYLNAYSDADQRKHQSSVWLAFVWGIHRDRWIPRTKGQLRGKCFHLMTSSCMNECGLFQCHLTHRFRRTSITFDHMYFWYQFPKPALVEVVTWCRAVNRPLLESTMPFLAEYPNKFYYYYNQMYFLENTLIWIPLDIIDTQSTLVYMGPRCRQTTSYI